MKKIFVLLLALAATTAQALSVYPYPAATPTPSTCTAEESQLLPRLALAVLSAEAEQREPALALLDRAVRRGCDINVDNGGRALELAIQFGDAPLVEWLLARGADPSLPRAGEPAAAQAEALLQDWLRLYKQTLAATDNPRRPEVLAINRALKRARAVRALLSR